MGSYTMFRTFITGAAFALLSATAGAQTLDTFYVNAFTLEADGSQGGYEFGFGWGDADKLRITQDGNNVTFQPNISLCNEDAGWCDATTALGGNWFIEASAFAETTVAAGDDAESFNFRGCFTGDSTTEFHELEAFMQVLNPDGGFAVYAGTAQTDSTGCWNMSQSEAGDRNAVVQYGLRMKGQNVAPANDAASGSVSVVLGAQIGGGGDLDLDPNAIPMLPLGALFGLIGVIVLVARRALA